MLRNVARQKDTFAFPTEKQGGVLYLSVNYSIPEWLIEKWIADYGYPVTKKMAASLLSEHPVTIRIHEDLSKEEKQQTIDNIMKQQIEITQHPYLPYAYWIEGMNGAGSLPGFKEGKVTIQDVSSMMAVQAAGIKSGMHVIDVCAAPGGKAMHAASKLKESGLVEARDVSDHKVAMIEEQIARCRYKNITSSVLDARNVEETSIESADVVLLDVPCSGLGVIGKKRDIKYRVTKESLKDIVKLQKEIVQTVWQYVKKGGTLIYSTCTLNKEENEQMVEWMTHSFPLMLGSIDSFIPYRRELIFLIYNFCDGIWKILRINTI